MRVGLECSTEVCERALALLDGARGESPGRDISTTISFQATYGAYLDTLGSDSKLAVRVGFEPTTAAWNL